MILNTALLCMALNVYHEARGESIAGQIAVAQVTMNRAGQEQNVCNVVLEPNQFSWTRKLVKGKRVTKRGMPTDMEAWNHALTISQVVLTGVIPDFIGGAKFYHEKTHRPSWRRQMTMIASIGNHTFYRLRNDNEQTLRRSVRSTLS